MRSGNQQMRVEFHNKANDKFFSIYQAFETAISSVSRRSEEYKYQQLKNRYAAIMEQELQAVAKEILVRHGNEKQLNEMDPMLNQFIKDYLHRFIQKANGL